MENACSKFVFWPSQDVNNRVWEIYCSIFKINSSYSPKDLNISTTTFIGCFRKINIICILVPWVPLKKNEQNSSVLKQA